MRDSDTGPPAIARLVMSAADHGRSLVFYRDLLGPTTTREAAGPAWLRTADGVEVMVHERPALPSEAAVSIIFAVDDPPRVVDDWARRGGAIVDPPDGHIVCVTRRK